MRGLERRATLSLDLKVGSVASLFVSRWDVPTTSRSSVRFATAWALRLPRVPTKPIASYSYPTLEEARGAGALPQRLLWASTGTKDPAAPDTLYVEALGAEGTIDTVPRRRCWLSRTTGIEQPTAHRNKLRRRHHRQVSARRLDDNALAARLQREGVASFAKSWRTLLAGIGEKSRPVASAVSA